MSKLIAYYRVSTAQQGRSGLGLEAQQAAVAAYVRSHAGELLAEYQEVESGKVNDRPRMQAALKHCRLTAATLVIAKLDRLSRDAHFLLGLQKANVDFLACDMPSADRFSIGVLAMVAQREREMASTRTREALAAAKARGTKLGNPNGAQALLAYRIGFTHGVAAVIKNADTRAQALSEVIDDIKGLGSTSLHAIANELNKRKIQTARGGSWHPASVSRLQQRIITAAR